MVRKRSTQIGLSIFLLAAYVAAGKLGLQLAFVNASATAVWIPTGIAIASILILGYEVLPVVLIGAFLVNFSTTSAFASSVIIAIGNTAEGFVGAYLVNRFASGKNAFKRVNDILKFTLFAAILSTMIAATVGLFALISFHLADWSTAGSVWLTWWLGDAVGAMTIAPILLLWAGSQYYLPPAKLIVEEVVFIATLVTASLIAFGNFIPALVGLPVAYLLIPLLVWPSLRFSQRETAFVIIITSGIALWGTLHGWGAFGSYPPNESLLLLQTFIGIIALTSWILGAVVAENAATKEKLSRANDTALEGWSKALDIRDRKTEDHAQRVTALTVELGKSLGLGEKDLAELRRGALLHDIGKISIPDEILFKPGPLTPEEWTVMRKHPVYAYELLKGTALEEAIDIPYAHHEKWDGTGYPRGLRGTEIPLAARIFAVIDVWDALRSERPYHKPMNDDEVFKYLDSLSGTHFDPSILRAFMTLMKRSSTAEK